MINLTPRVQLIEAVWTLIVLYGLFYSCLNLFSAIEDRRALRKSGSEDEKTRKWANFSVFMHSAFVFVDGVFALAGVIAMLRRPSPDADTTSSLVLAGMFISASLLLSVLSMLWKKVDEALKS